MTATAQALSSELLDAWNARDLDAFMRLLADDVEWYDPAMAQPPARGRAAVREFAEAVLEAFPDFRYDVVPPVCASSDGTRCALVWRISATHTGVLRPMGYAPTGRLASFEGVDVIDARDGKITRIRTAFDPIAAAEQLLAMSLRPKPGTWRAAIAVAVQRVIARVRRKS
jgi:steroid delta-isomerase-like uncharacterized protein